MTDKLRAAAEAALEALLESDPLGRAGTIEKLRAALAEQDQLRDATKMTEAKPVAWRKRGGAITDDPFRASCWRDDEGAEVMPLYTTPPRREWVGLTDEEIVKLIPNTDAWNYQLGLEEAGDFARAIEQKLKEKNT